MSLNHDLSSLFSTIADIMDLKGENPFKAISYRKVSRILKELPHDVSKCVEDNTLCEIEGIGEHSQHIIEEYVKTGRSTEADVLIQSVPAGLMPLLQIEGLGPKTVALFWNHRKITNADQLLSAINDGSLLDLKGIGEKKLASIKRGIEHQAKAGGRRGIGDVLPIAQDLIARVRQLPGVARAEIAGSLRRWRETIGDVDLLCAVKDASAATAITDAFVKFPGVERILGHGPTKVSIVTGSGLQVDLRVLPQEHFGAALLYFTGSKEHNVRIRGLAQKKHMTLNEWGLYDEEKYDRAAKKTAEAPPVKPIASRTEEEIYKHLGLQYIEPELREDRGEVDAALHNKLPALVRREDIRGDLHTHTTASDGTASIAEMAEAAQALGYEYLAITDHSKSQVIANGLPPARLLKHVKEIRKLNDKLKGITLLAGAEVDIMPDGRLDYEDAVLAELDIVIASPHFALKQDPKKATDRLVRAIDNRYVNVIGHPTGRLINAREGLPLDFPALFKAATNTTALEINAGYPRLDLDELNARAAIASGCLLSINTDAHSTGELPHNDFGLAVARRAWVTSSHIINCMKLAELKPFLSHKR